MISDLEVIVRDSGDIAEEDEDLAKRVCDWTDEIVHKKLKPNDNIYYKSNEELVKESLAKLAGLGFRKYPVYPTAEELAVDYDPAIQSNIIKGKYKDVEQYLDIQYRLLREDFVRPLRKSIIDYKKAIRRVERPLIPGVYIYHNVIIHGRCAESPNSYNATFDDFELGPSNWKDLKRTAQTGEDKERLYFGSLICFSSDHFRTYRFATIRGNKTEENLKNFRFSFKIESELMGTNVTLEDIIANNKMFRSFDERQTFVAIEAPAYFEAYRYNLLALQNIDITDYPLNRYIIDINPDILCPSYLTPLTVYNLSNIICEVVAIPDVEEIDDDCVIVDEQPKKYESVHIHNQKEWPTPSEMDLDESQFEAFKFVLLNQLALIQGPPGTGKTYVGLKIVETIYRNRCSDKDHVQMFYKMPPIVIVCYTNHALDQFLEGILDFCPSLLRIGGGSKSERLKKYTLRQGRRHNNYQSIYQKDIIGMTTTGAAKFRDILTKLNPKIVVIEEAAEVPECHVITALTKRTEHLILIGDHQQLRPTTADYELTLQHKTNISLFERMIINGMPYRQLKYQHRMRPEISRLLTPHIYKELFNHEVVYKYENIRGAKKNMFFINHYQNESTNSDRLSRSNEFEAEFIVKLCRYFIYQGYESYKITILTLYSSQFFVIRNKLRNDDFYEGVKVEVLDSFQGEENDIILISFVRCNDNNDIGFLKIENRINVSLSRAKKGLYCIGNFEGLAQKSPLWRNICDYLFKAKAIGPAIELVCQHHPHKSFPVMTIDDFKKLPYGGCKEPCDEVMDCGHRCPFKTCHPMPHRSINCPAICRKEICDQKHECEQRCHYPKECKPCVEPIKELMPECGHTLIRHCHEESRCRSQCEKLLKCGHKCLNKCSDPCQLICREMIDAVISRCGHQTKVECHEKTQTLAKIECPLPCDKWLSCGHKCKQLCRIRCADKCQECWRVLDNRNDWSIDDDDDDDDQMN